MTSRTTSGKASESGYICYNTKNNESLMLSKITSRVDCLKNSRSDSNLSKETRLGSLTFLVVVLAEKAMQNN
eukprot:5165714-Amphidinium_carterae.2